MTFSVSYVAYRLNNSVQFFYFAVRKSDRFRIWENKIINDKLRFERRIVFEIQLFVIFEHCGKKFTKTYKKQKGK